MTVKFQNNHNMMLFTTHCQPRPLSQWYMPSLYFLLCSSAHDWWAQIRQLSYINHGTEILRSLGLS